MCFDTPDLVLECQTNKLFLPVSGDLRTLQPPPDAKLPEFLRPQDVQHPSEIVGCHHQAELSPAFLQPPHQKLMQTTSMFQSSERMFNNCSSFFHLLHAPPHPLPMPVNYILMLPTSQYPCPSLCTQTVFSHCTGLAINTFADVLNICS